MFCKYVKRENEANLVSLGIFIEDVKKKDEKKIKMLLILLHCEYFLNKIKMKSFFTKPFIIKIT